ncbi:MAG: hypothetical protein J6D44_13145 [Pseudomonas sp.]|nr:hypothetical protein [Pseudomonas sp.]
MPRRDFTKVPFAATGDVTSIPTAVQPDGSVSMTTGYGFDYQRDNGAGGGTPDPLAKSIPRDATNGILNEITASIGEIQLNGLAIWAASAAPYPINATVRHNNTNWLSTVANNSAQPGVAPLVNWFDTTAKIVQATESVAGIAKIATAQQALEGTDNATIMTPLKNKNAYGLGDSFPLTDLNNTRVGYWQSAGSVPNGPENTGILHGVTRGAPSQTGTYVQLAIDASTGAIYTRSFTTVWTAWVKFIDSGRIATESASGIARIATAQQALEGTDNATIMTPAKTKAVIAQAAPGAATESQAGIVALATAEEASAGTNAVKAMSPARVIDAIARWGLGGSRQTPTILDGSRLPNVTYTNSTGSPISVYAIVSIAASTQGYLVIDGVNFIKMTYATGGGIRGEAFSAIIPIGATYRTVGIQAIQSWSELR